MTYWLKIIGLNLAYIYLAFVVWVYVPTAVAKIGVYLLLSFVMFRVWVKWHHHRRAAKHA